MLYKVAGIAVTAMIFSAQGALSADTLGSRPRADFETLASAPAEPLPSSVLGSIRGADDDGDLDLYLVNAPGGDNSFEVPGGHPSLVAVSESDAFEIRASDGDIVLIPPAALR